MATLIEAFRRYGPKVQLRGTIPQRELAQWISMRTGLNENQVVLVLQELKEAILYFNRMGLAVKLPGLGGFSPSINRDGQYRINLRIDRGLRKGMNVEDGYSGPIENRQNIGLDNEALKARWDGEFPDDPLQL
jgi:hypothetical protein